MHAVLDDKYPIFCAVAELQNIQRLGYLAPTSPLNTLLNPLGEAPARGWFCLQRKHLDEINLNAVHTLKLDSTGDKIPPITFRNLLFASEPLCLTPGTLADPTSVFLCELSDYRHLLASEAMGIGMNAQYNVRAPAWGGDYYQATQNTGPTPWTWQTMVTSLWSLMTTFLGATTYATLPFTPHGTPEGWKFVGVSAWTALNQVLRRLGCAVKWNPTLTTGAYSIVRIGSADSTALATMTAAEGRKIFDREYQQVILGRVPWSIRVYFHTQYEHYGTEQTTPKNTDQWSTIAASAVDVASGVTGVASGVRHHIWDDLPNLVDVDGVSTNAAALALRAAERAADFLRMVYGVGGGRLHRIYSGLLNLQPGSIVKGVAWRQDLLGLGGHTPGELITEVVRHPYWMLRSSDAGTWEQSGRSSIDNQAPDFGPTYPIYPHLLQIIDVTGAPDGNGLQAASVTQHDPADGSLTAKDTVYAFEVS